MAVTFTDTKGNRHDLPKLTIGMSEEMDAIAKCSDNNERYRRQYDFMGQILSDEELAAELDGDSIETIDLVALNILYVAVVNAYALPVQKAQMDNVRAQLKMVQPAMGALNSISNVANLKNALNGMSR